MSERNPWLGEKKHSSFLDGSSSGWPDWDTNDSSKCRDRSRWSSWEIYQGNKDIHKDDAVGKGAPTALDSWSDKKRIEQCNSEISERNPWLRTENHSSSLDNSSRGWSDWDTGDSPKCNKHSGWPSWESLQGNKDLHKDDAIGKGALTISDSCSGEQRGRGRVRKRSTERGRRRTPKRDKSSWETKRSRSRERDYGKSRNGSPFSGLTQASCVSTETGSDFGMTSRRCRDFAAGKCVRGSRCRFVHHGYLEKRERNHLENQVAERSRVTADHGGSLQHGDYKRSADSLRDISNGRGKYYEDDEGRKNTICCKQFLRGKCYRGTSCRYSHHKAAGEDYHKGNEGAVCVQNVKSLAKLGGRSDDDKWEQNFDVTKSWNGPRWDNNGGSLDTGKNRACLEDEKKSWNGPKWGDEASFPDAPKATGWGDSSARTTNSRDPATAEYRTDESKVKGCPEWSEKLSDKSKKNGLKWDNGGGSVVTGKNRVCSEDEKNPWNGPTWGDEACFPDEPKAIGWGKSSARTTNSHDPVIADYRTEESKVKRCREWSEILSDRSKKNGPEWDNNALSLDTRKNRACLEDEKKSWNGPKWGDEASFPDEPKATGWGDSSARTTNSHDPATADYRTDESKVKGCPEWSEKLSDRSKKNGLKWDNGGGSVVTGKNRVCSEDEKNPWNGPTWGDEACFPDEPKAIGWGNSSARTTNSHDPVIAVYRTDESKVKRCREWSEIFSDRSKKNGPKWDNNASRLNTRKNRACTEDEKKPWNGPSWGDEASFPDDPKATGWGESSARTNNSHDPATADYRTDESKVKGCPEWSEKVSDRTKKESPLLDTAKAMEVWEDRNDPKIVADRPPSSGRGNSSFRNKISHVPVAANELNRGNHSNDPTCSDVAPSLDGLQGTVWDGRSRGNMYSQDRSVVKKQIDNNLVCSSVKKSSQRADPGWSEKFPERDEWCSGGNGADNHHTKLTDLKMLVNRKKPVDQWEDKATLWSGPTWDDKDCSSDRPEATGWGGRSRGNTDTHVSADTEKENVCEVVNSLAQKSNGSVASRWNEKVTERDEYMLSHWQNNYNGRVTRTSKPTDSIRLMDGEEATNEWEDGRKCLDKGTSKLVDSEKLYEVGDLGFPPSSSRSGTNESCHAPSRNHFNGLNNFLDRSVQHKVSVRNQMRIQLDKAVKIPENGERELINLESSPTPVTENGQQNPLDTTGEQCKQDHRSTHSASFEAQCNAGESNSNQDTVMTWSFKIALVELVKEILKPTWKKGKMSKEVHIAIVKKAVDKVISAETERDNIPKTQEHIDYYLSVSKPCITNFVKEYIVHYGIQDDLGR